MKILITGTSGLGKELGAAYADHQVTLVSRSTGHDINNISAWGHEFLTYDMVINCAYDGLGQQLMLDYFFNHWQLDPAKTIVTIGSKIITQPRIDISQDHDYWPYRLNKQALQLMHDSMLYTAKCNLKIFNPGAFDSSMTSGHNIPKMSLPDLAVTIKSHIENPVIKRVDLWL